MRKFEKISFEQFKKDISDDINLYHHYHLPMRKTKFSAGYDFESLFDFVLKPNEIIKIPTGIKSVMNQNEVLLLFIRSSVGFQYNIRLVNQVGVIDQDYYNNINNEGHIFIKIKNEGTKDFIVKKGDPICQGIFTTFLTVENEEEVTNIRIGGIGSTTKEEEK